MTDLELAYAAVSKVAVPSESEGLKKERAILMLWYLRNAHGIDDLDAYEFVCDGDNDQGVDALVLDPKREGHDYTVLHVFQSKYPITPKNVGVNEVKGLVGSLAPFETAEGLRALLAGQVEPELRALIVRFGLIEMLEAGTLRVEATLVVAGALLPEARKLIAAENSKRGRDAIRGVDVFDLAPLIDAFTSPATVSGKVTVTAPANQRFVAELETGRVAVCSVRVKELVLWPGIDDRRLFDLNVRRELGRTSRVRQALERAIGKSTDHKNFLAFHNGLTVVCSKIDESHPDKLEITDLSVVNGAQSTIAFRDNSSQVTEDLKIVVKFVEVPATSQLAREVAIRSNTQNPVNARNLRARDGIQLRLEKEVADQYNGFTYELRPDASVATPGKAIQNDDAAQLLCAVFSQEPWNAVRRLLLFEAEYYSRIFTKDTTASHVVLSHRIAERVQEWKAKFPESYRGSWRLTKLVAVYLVGQLLRATPEHQALLDNPAAALKRKDLDTILDRVVKFSAAALVRRHDKHVQDQTADDFKVEFKRESALRDLAEAARNAYLTYKTVEE